MMIDYNKAWNAMNDLEQIMYKLSNAREIMDSATNAIEDGNTKKAASLNYAAGDYLETIMNEFDNTFKIAWDETIKKIKYSPVETWTLNVEEDFAGEFDHNLYINLPENLCDDIGLREGDQFVWSLFPGTEDQWIIKKINSNLE